MAYYKYGAKEEREIAEYMKSNGVQRGDAIRAKRMRLSNKSENASSNSPGLTGAQMKRSGMDALKKKRDQK